MTTFLLLLAAVLAAGSCRVLAAEAPAAGSPPIHVLMLGHASSRGFEPWWPKFQAACAREGVRVHIMGGVSGLDYPLYTEAVLRKFHVVIYGGLLDTVSKDPRDMESVAAFRERLHGYYEAGGSVLWVPMAFMHWGTLWNHGVGDRYDVRSLEEALYDRPKQVDVNPALRNEIYRYLLTTDVTPHPVTEKVRGLLLPLRGEWSWPGVVPMQFGPSWTVLIRGMDSTVTMGNAAPTGSGRHEFKPEIQGRYRASPEIVGARERVNGGGRTVRPGEALRLRFLVFMRPWQGQNSNLWLRNFIRDFGIGGPAAAPVTIDRGRLRERNYALDLDAVEGGAALTVGQYDLPHNLLVRVHGLPANAIAGRYDLDSRQLMLLPVFEGAAATSVNTTLGDTRLYVGELFHCSDEDVLLSAVQDGADKLLLELHNPGDETATVSLTAAPGFTPLSGMDETIEIPPCASVQRVWTTPPGSLVYAAYRGD